jgi:L-arabinokinase
MDQLASCFGEPGRLLPIQCQPDRLLPLINLPENIAFVGMDSGVRHAVSGASYTDVRTAAFMGFSIIAQSEGCTPADIRRAWLGADASHLPFGGYLCNIAPSVFEKKYAPLLPERVSGNDFLEKFKETHDPVTQVEPMKFYAVKNSARHPVYENFRVRIFGELLRQPLDFEALNLLGELMYQSHESYTACGLGNARTDELVDMVRRAGKESGVFGAKITGGGSGGTVCVLCYGAEGLSGARAIFDSYRQTHGERLKFIH